MADERNYPVTPITAPDDDPRMSWQLVVEVAAVIHRHGYPQFTPGDQIALAESLHRYLYRGTS